MQLFERKKTLDEVPKAVLIATKAVQHRKDLFIRSLCCCHIPWLFPFYSHTQETYSDTFKQLSVRLATLKKANVLHRCMSIKA